MSPSTSTEAVSLEGIGKLESIFPTVSKGSIRSVTPLTIINVSASQNNCVCLVLRHQNVPLALLVLSLNEMLTYADKIFAYIHCAVNSGGCTNDNGMKTSAIIE